MKNGLCAFGAVVKNTFEEILCVPVYLVIVTCALVLAGLMPNLSVFAFDEEAKLVSDSLLSLSFLIGIFIAAVSAGICVGNEYKRKTVLLILSKPVGRVGFLLAKYTGICLCAALFFALSFIAGVVALKMIAVSKLDQDANALLSPQTWWLLFYYLCFIVSYIAGGIANYVFRKNFSFWTFVFLCATLGVLALGVVWDCDIGQLQDFFNFGLVQLLVFCAAGIMCAITVGVSLKFDVLACIVIAVSVFIVGLMADYLFSPLGPGVVTVLHGVIPDWHCFWMADALSSGRMIPLSYVGGCFVYAAGFVGWVLLAALGVARLKDIS